MYGMTGPQQMPGPPGGQQLIGMQPPINSGTPQIVRPMQPIQPQQPNAGTGGFRPPPGGPGSQFRPPPGSGVGSARPSSPLLNALTGAGQLQAQSGGYGPGMVGVNPGGNPSPYAAPGRQPNFQGGQGLVPTGPGVAGAFTGNPNSPNAPPAWTQHPIPNQAGGYGPMGPGNINPGGSPYYGGYPAGWTPNYMAPGAGGGAGRGTGAFLK